jgi:hypothetical protein
MAVQMVVQEEVEVESVVEYLNFVFAVVVVVVV